MGALLLALVFHLPIEAASTDLGLGLRATHGTTLGTGGAGVPANARYWEDGTLRLQEDGTIRVTE